jgi:hypothetical protein
VKFVFILKSFYAATISDIQIYLFPFTFANNSLTLEDEMLRLSFVVTCDRYLHFDRISLT